MTRAEFYAGREFKVFGIFDSLVYSISTEELMVIREGPRQVIHRTCIIEDDDNAGFTALVPAFGTLQMVLIKFASCEIK